MTSVYDHTGTSCVGMCSTCAICQCRLQKCGAKLPLNVCVLAHVCDTSQSVRADNCAQVNTEFPSASRMIQLQWNIVTNIDTNAYSYINSYINSLCFILLRLEHREAAQDESAQLT